MDDAMIGALFLLAASATQAGDFRFGGKVFADISSLQQNNDRTGASHRAWDGDLKRLYLRQPGDWLRLGGHSTRVSDRDGRGGRGRALSV